MKKRNKYLSNLDDEARKLLQKEQGDAIKNKKQIQLTKRILKKCTGHGHRSEAEIGELAEILRGIKFFKEKS